MKNVLKYLFQIILILSVYHYQKNNAKYYLNKRVVNVLIHCNLNVQKKCLYILRNRTLLYNVKIILPIVLRNHKSDRY